MPTVKYDKFYAEDAAACGAPFPEFAAFCAALPPGRVLDLGCGQGRDALMFARAGHRVLGVDISAVGVRQLVETAASEGLDVEAVLADIVDFETEECFDVVVLDRVLHMLDSPARPGVIATAQGAVADGGHLLVAEGPKGLTAIAPQVCGPEWEVVRRTRNRLIVRRAAGG